MCLLVYLCINHPSLLHIRTLSLAPGSQWSSQLSYKTVYLQRISKVVTHIDTLEGGHGYPFQNSWLENPHRHRSLAGYSPWAWKELDTFERLSTCWYLILKRGCNIFSRFLFKKKKRQKAKLGLFYRGKIESIGPFFQCYQQDTLQPSSLSNGICEDLVKTYHLFVIFNKKHNLLSKLKQFFGLYIHIIECKVSFMTAEEEASSLVHCVTLDKLFSLSCSTFSLC